MPVEPESVGSEQLLGRLLRNLPLRRAPVTLESRVFSELQRRAALPWWHRGFTSWSLVTRAAFVAICSAIIAFTLLGSWAIAGVRTLNGFGALAMSWTQPAIATMAAAGEFSALLVRVIPETWLYGTLAVGATLYGLLFGLGAAAYRSLYLQPSGDRS
jgi:hypothetical protein